MLKLASLRGFLPTRVILLTVAFMIVTHMVVLTFYTYHHQVTQAVAQRNGVIQQVMNIIHMVEATPPTQIARAISALQEPNISTELSAEPLYPIHVNVLSFWRINKLVPQDAKEINLSLHLADNRWLNVNAKISQSDWLTHLFLLLLEAFVVFIVFFYLWSINRFTKPLKDFQHAAEQLGVNIHSQTQLEEFDGPPIVRETAQAMNTMQKRIRDLLRDRTLLLAAISHDLRTPITRLKLRANKIQDKALYDKTLFDLNEMENMIAEILAFARNDKSSEKKVRLDLNSFLQAICDDFIDVGYPVSYQGCEKRVPFYGRPLTVKRAFSNLIKNAINYGFRADVTLRREKERSIITIDDKGPGIPESDLEKVFAPFYRCDHSRSREIAGTGLGLATARDAIVAHGGDINLRNRPLGGLRVTITLP